MIYLLSKQRRKLIAIALFGFLLGTMVTGVDYIKRKGSPMHVITSSFAVVAKNSSGNYVSSSVGNPGYNDVKLAEDIAQSVIFVTKSDRVLSAVIQQNRFLGISADEIRDNLTVKQHDNTQIITMELRWINDSEGLSIVDAICDNIPDILIDTLNLGSVSIIDFPKDTGIEKTSIQWSYILLSVVFFAGGYFCYIVLMNLFRPTMTDLGSIEKDLDGLECLGIIPDDTEFFLNRPFSISDEVDLEHFQVQEALIAASHVVMHISEHEKHKCFYITSSDSNEGKTVIAANLAIEISNRNRRVLLIDMDIRKPSLGSCFFETVEYSHSLNAVYEGRVSAEEAVLSVSDTLDVLPARLEKEHVRLDNVLLSRLKSLFDKYDIVLMDTPPVGLVSDTVLLNAISDQAIMVVRFDYVCLDTIKANIRRLRKSGIDTCGVVITQASQSAGSGYYPLFHSYDSYYSGLYPSKKSEKRKEKKRVKKVRKHRKAEKDSADTGTEQS